MDDQVSTPDVPGPGKDDVLASEAATYTFCAKAWHLEHVLRRPASAGAAGRRSAGMITHEEHGTRLEELRRWGPRIVMWTTAFLLLAAVLLVIGLLFSEW